MSSAETNETNDISKNIQHATEDLYILWKDIVETEEHYDYHEDSAEKLQDRRPLNEDEKDQLKELLSKLTKVGDYHLEQLKEARDKEQRIKDMECAAGFTMEEIVKKIKIAEDKISEYESELAEFESIGELDAKDLKAVRLLEKQADYETRHKVDLLELKMDKEEYDGEMFKFDP